MLKDLFVKKQVIVAKVSKNNEYEKKPRIPVGMWEKCNKCKKIIYYKDLEKSNYICIDCGYHFRITANQRINIFFDLGTFKELWGELKSSNPIKFKGYNEKINKAKEKTDSSEAVVTGIGRINGIEIACAIMDSFFLMGSMGTVVGEKITRLVEYATKNNLPVIIFSASGGARMQEGMFSLMQMVKVSAALSKHDEAGLLYISILTNPTTGGITASFAMQGDIILSEPNALIAFAGRRVIQDTIKESLPENFQTSEFLLEKGFIDSIVNRNEMKEYIHRILKLHGYKC